jgi:hypothetical protein
LTGLAKVAKGGEGILSFVIKMGGTRLIGLISLEIMMVFKFHLGI